MVANSRCELTVCEFVAVEVPRPDGEQVLRPSDAFRRGSRLLHSIDRLAVVDHQRARLAVRVVRAPKDALSVHE